MGYSLIERLNPQARFPYVCEEERGSGDFTIFYIKPLTIFEYRHCEDSGSSNERVGAFGLKALTYGLVGWDNFLDEDGKIIPFDVNNISAIPYQNQLELSSEIIKISDVEEDLVEEITTVIKFSDWSRRNEQTARQWNCEYCQEKKLDKVRNCDGTMPRRCPKCNKDIYADECDVCLVKTKPKFMFRFTNFVDDYVDRCPLSMMTPRAIKLTNLVNTMDNSKSLPFSGGALEQTYFFYSLRSIVLSEQDSILRRELDDAKKKSKVSKK
jgi:hypothetical protein